MRVLIVEDDMVIAGGMVPVVTEAGHELVGLAADRETAIALLGSANVHLALIDLRLADGWTGVDVARAAAANGVTAVFMTANPGLLPTDLAGASGLIEKPYDDDGLRAVLGYFAVRLAGALDEPPSCLRLPVHTDRATPAIAANSATLGTRPAAGAA